MVILVTGVCRFSFPSFGMRVKLRDQLHQRILFMVKAVEFLQQERNIDHRQWHDAFKLSAEAFGDYLFFESAVQVIVDTGHPEYMVAVNQHRINHQVLVFFVARRVFEWLLGQALQLFYELTCSFFRVVKFEIDGFFDGLVCIGADSASREIGVFDFDEHDVVALPVIGIGMPGIAGSSKLRT
jgi:hypothetical protein